MPGIALSYRSWGPYRPGLAGTFEPVVLLPVRNDED
jgi:hypothetical protein